LSACYVRRIWLSEPVGENKVLILYQNDSHETANTTGSYVRM
jgi:hypothetical protein